MIITYLVYEIKDPVAKIFFLTAILTLIPSSEPAQLHILVNLTKAISPQIRDDGLNSHRENTNSGCATHAPLSPHHCLGLCLLILLLTSVLYHPTEAVPSGQTNLKLSLSPNSALTARLKLELTDPRPPRAPCLRHPVTPVSSPTRVEVS